MINSINSTNPIRKPLDGLPTEQKKTEDVSQKTNAEETSLNLQPQAVAGRSMVQEKTTEETLPKELYYYVVSRESFIGRVSDIAKTEDFEKTTVEDLMRLYPISKNYVLDVETPIQVTERRKAGNPVSDERIEKVKNAISDIEQNTTFTRMAIHQMLLDEEEKLDFYNKWLHYYDKNIHCEEAMPRTMAILTNLVFGSRSKVKNELEEEKVKLFEKLVENKEVLEAIRNQEINILSGISLGYKNAKKTPLRNNILQLYSNMTDNFLIEKIMETTKFQYSSTSLINTTILTSANNGLLEILATHGKDEIINNLKKVQNLKQKALKTPSLYVNGQLDFLLSYQRVTDFFNENSVELVRLVSTFDDDVIDVLMRKRFKEFYNILNSTNAFTHDDLELLKAMTKCKKADGTPFSQAEKAEFIDLISAYKNNRLEVTKIKEMTAKGKIDTQELEQDLFRKIIKNTGMSDEDVAAIPVKKLTAWDIKYAHLLAKGISQTCFDDELENGFKDIIKAANLYDFETYLHDETNKYGKANANTKQMFEDADMNYEKWFRPSKDLEMSFVSKDKCHEQLRQIADFIVEDMNYMMLTPVKNHIKKQFPQFIKGDKFVIPTEYVNNRTKLLELAEGLVDKTEKGKMSAVWKRAKGNLDTEKKYGALATLTFLDHFEERVNDIKNININTEEKDLDLKIKMWDRFPQKDLFQGNYSGCCIGIGNTNGSAMPHYLLNTAYNMIELVDNNTGKIVGNALCYFIKTDDKPAFVIDNIEINSNEKPSKEVGVNLRTAIAQYGAKIAEQVTGNPDTPIYMSDRYNDVPYFDVPSEKKEISFLGDIACDRIYMDLFNTAASWTSKRKLTQTVNALRLR